MLDAMLDPELLEPERIRPLTRREYDRMVDLGMFEDERIELLRGQLVTMSPQGSPHSILTGRLAQRLTRALDETFEVLSHSPFAASDDSEPEPDISVSRRRLRGTAHPRKALLLIEVAESSLRKDRAVKSSIYAEANVPEYWIVDLKAKLVHVFTRPSAAGYKQIEVHKRGDMLVPLKLPGIALGVTDILSGR